MSQTDSGMDFRPLRYRGAAGNAEWGKLKRSFHRQFKRTLRLHDPKHMQWRTVVQREVDRLYHSLHEMVSMKLVDPEHENPEEAIFGVLCLLGDCVLADKWLSQWSKMIRFDFELVNFCEKIEEWLFKLRLVTGSEEISAASAESVAGMYPPNTWAAVSETLLQRVYAERLEGCTVLHLAAMSGDNSMVVAVTTIWDEVIREMLLTARQQLSRRPDDENLLKRVEDYENEWRQHNSLGESAYDLVPECFPAGKSQFCRCSACFNEVQCTSHLARKGLLASTETEAPLFFSGTVASVLVLMVVALVSLHTSSQNSAGTAETVWSWTEWGGIGVSFALLWLVLSLSSVVRHIWNILHFGLVMLDVLGAPCTERPPPTAPDIAKIKIRRMALNLERMLAMVVATESPSEAQLNLLEEAMELPQRFTGLKHSTESILGEDLVRNARQLLASRREARRRGKEQAYMRNLANSIMKELMEVELEVRTNVNAPMSKRLKQRAWEELLKAKDGFINDKRLRTDEDILRVAIKHAQLKRLVELREQLQEALEDPRDDVFEQVVRNCRDARIVDSKAVKARLKAIDQPRTVLAQLTDAVGAAALDASKLQRALSSAQDCPHRPDLIATKDKAAALLSALNTLEMVKVNGRKAHAQLLVSSDHDIGHIAKLENELAVFSQVCLDSRGDLPGPHNVVEVRKLLEKWKREEGPSRDLKAAVANTDLSVLREAIRKAKDAGIGIKAAKKRLAALELNERIREDLEHALGKQHTKQLAKAVTAGVKAGLDVAEAKAVLAQLVQRDACSEQLAQAISSHNEVNLTDAIAAARRHGVDCAVAQKLLDTLVRKRLTDSILKEEARAARRLQEQAELDKLLAIGSDCPLPELVDKTRLARAVGADVTKANSVLRTRVVAQLDAAMAPAIKDATRLSDAIRTVALLDGFGVDIDIKTAKATLERWQKQKNVSKSLKIAAENARKVVDDRTILALEDALGAAEAILDEEGWTRDVLDEARVALYEAKGLLELRAAERTCRVTHEQACMMHPRVDTPEREIPDYITKFRALINAAKGKVPDAAVAEMRKQTDTWEKEAELVFELRDPIYKRDAVRLEAAIAKAQKESKSINVEPPKRTLEKLVKQVEKQEIAARLAEAMNVKSNCTSLTAAIEEARAAGLQTFDAMNVLMSWQHEGRHILKTARDSRSRDQVREALDAVAEMGLRSLPEWLDAKKYLESRVVPKLAPKTPKVINAVIDDSIIDSPKHPRWKTEICNHWLTHGYCSYGKERCNFAHGEDDLRRPATVYAASDDGSETASQTSTDGHSDLISTRPSHPAWSGPQKSPLGNSSVDGTFGIAGHTQPGGVPSSRAFAPGHSVSGQSEHLYGDTNLWGRDPASASGGLPMAAGTATKLRAAGVTTPGFGLGAGQQDGTSMLTSDLSSFSTTPHLSRQQPASSYSTADSEPIFGRKLTDPGPGSSVDSAGTVWEDSWRAAVPVQGILGAKKHLRPDVTPFSPSLQSSAPARIEPITSSVQVPNWGTGATNRGFTSESDWTRSTASNHATDWSATSLGTPSTSVGPSQSSAGAFSAAPDRWADNSSSASGWGDSSQDAKFGTGTLGGLGGLGQAQSLGPLWGDGTVDGSLQGDSLSSQLSVGGIFPQVQNPVLSSPVTW